MRRDAIDRTGWDGTGMGDGDGPPFPPLRTDSALGWRRFYGRLDGEARPIAVVPSLGCRPNRHAGKLGNHRPTNQSTMNLPIRREGKREKTREKNRERFKLFAPIHFVLI
ncbi:hypothetical protein F5Y14DRAFT_413557 [Nemania sp. NC0429]|nr:hypothetical protein F5Y14DRAFT_413557 [Nemania sp. NC0429]